MPEPSRRSVPESQPWPWIFFLLNIHRPVSPIRLRPPGGSLFPVAELRICSVIYIIIAMQMQTSHTTASNTASNQTARIHSILAVVGIVTAIICSLVLVNDRTQSTGTKLNISKSPISAITGRISRTNDVSLISKIESLVKF